MFAQKYLLCWIFKAQLYFSSLLLEVGNIFLSQIFEKKYYLWKIKCLTTQLVMNQAGLWNRVCVTRNQMRAPLQIFFKNGKEIGKKWRKVQPIYSRATFKSRLLKTRGPSSDVQVGYPKTQNPGETPTFLVPKTDLNPTFSTRLHQ